MTTTTNTPRKLVAFSYDKNGKKIAYYWRSGRGSICFGRFFRMPVADAVLMVAMGEAIEVEHDKSKLF